jgi:hypothetical protein
MQAGRQVHAYGRADAGIRVHLEARAYLPAHACMAVARIEGRGGERMAQQDEDEQDQKERAD